MVVRTTRPYPFPYHIGAPYEALLTPSPLYRQVSMEDFQNALHTTQPSTAAHEHEQYKAWNDEYGCR